MPHRHDPTNLPLSLPLDLSVDLRSGHCPHPRLPPDALPRPLRWQGAICAALSVALYALMPVGMLATIAPTRASAAATTKATTQPAQALIDAATQRLRTQIAATFGASDAPRITITLPKRATRLPACTALSAFLPGANAANPTLHPRMSVGLRCSAPAIWNVYAQATVSVPGRYYVAARTLAPGQALTESDLTPRQGDLLRLPRNAVTEPAAVRGLRTEQRLASGQVVRIDTLSAVATIQRGQTITLHVRGTGFHIHNTGQALAAGAPGQTIPVRTASGQTVSAIVRDGQSAEVLL